MSPDKRQKLEEQLSAYLDGELTAQERQEVEAFLAQDPQARALLKELQATAHMVSSMPRAKASEELMAGIQARLERQDLLGDAEPIETSKPRSYRYIVPWIAAAAVIVLSFTTAYWMRTISEQEAQTPAMREQFASKDELNKRAAQPIAENDYATKGTASIEKEEAKPPQPLMRARAKLAEDREETSAITDKAGSKDNKQFDATERKLKKLAETPSSVKKDQNADLSITQQSFPKRADKPSATAKPPAKFHPDKKETTYDDFIKDDSSPAATASQTVPVIKLNATESLNGGVQATNIGTACLTSDALQFKVSATYPTTTTATSTNPTTSQPASAPATSTAPATQPTATKPTKK